MRFEIGRGFKAAVTMEDGTPVPLNITEMSVTITGHEIPRVTLNLELVEGDSVVVYDADLIVREIFGRRVK